MEMLFKKKSKVDDYLVSTDNAAKLLLETKRYFEVEKAYKGWLGKCQGQIHRFYIRVDWESVKDKYIQIFYKGWLGKCQGQIHTDFKHICIPKKLAENTFSTVANFSHISISVRQNHPKLIFKVIKETYVKGNLVTIFKVVRQIVMKLLYWRKKKHTLHPKLKITKLL